jgi:hypothetical protein
MEIISKAKILKNIKIYGAIIPKLKIYKCKAFFENQNFITKDIKKEFKSLVAIRSTSKYEDTNNSSNAGKFLSFLNISVEDTEDLKGKILQVIKSYKKNITTQEFFVQDMIKNIKISGVLLTRELENYFPCYNFNYFIGKNSNVVTSGKNGSKNFIYIENKKYKINKKFLKLVRICKQIKKITHQKDLDIEFAIDKNGKIYILQIRKLIVPIKFNKIKINPKIIFTNLEKKIKKLSKKHYNLFGKKTYFGVMPDWNPAEIIGRKPRPLALSLYQELITDHIWSENRKIYGYKDLSQFHLMTTFYGTPYIDIRIDFNSWLPEGLDNNLSEKIINLYLNNFKKKKYLHDKVEFEILFTCYSPDTKNKINEQLKKFLNNKEIKLFKKNLKLINFNAINNIDNEIKLIKTLTKKQKFIKKSTLYYIDKIYWLIEDCKKFGTLPFAGLARCAFISTEILNSFVKKKILTEEEKLKFLSTIKTITTELKSDLDKNKKKFIVKYGHLRPGTYEITSPNYKKKFNTYFNLNNKIIKKKINKKNIFIFNKIQKKKINKFIKEIKVYKNFNHLISFITKSIKYREYSKFVFTKNIDLVFENLEKFGKKFSINIDDLSYVKIHKILDLYFNLSNKKIISNLKRHIKENKIEYKNNNYINVPDIITSGKDLFVQDKIESKINFISNKYTEGRTIKLDLDKLNKNLDGIICIENADPGYDFLFTKNIKGLVTMYGGQNSHMAIRCAELGIPALIGVGEKIYNRIIENKFISIDCNLKKIEFLSK